MFPTQQRTDADTVVNWRLIGLAGVLLCSSLITLSAALAWLGWRSDADEATVVAVEPIAKKTKKFADMRLEAPRADVVRATPAKPEELMDRPAAPIFIPPVRAVVPAPDKSANIIVDDRADLETEKPLLHGQHSDKALFDYLEHGVRVLDLGTKTGQDMAARAKENRVAKSEALETSDAAMRELLARRDDLRGLPIQLGKACQTGEKQAVALAGYGGELHGMLRNIEGRRVRSIRGRSAENVSFGGGSALHSDAALVHLLRSGNAKADAVPALVQVLQAEDVERRRLLVGVLSGIKGQPASAALVQRALFDHVATVRLEALTALKQRPLEEIRPSLLQGLRHPWPPVADHAADALIYLGDRDAVPELIKLLDEPDPRLPFQNGQKKWMVPELVKVNHLRNCQLCHAPSFDVKDPVRGFVPTPGEPIPELYYDSGRGSFVRADVVYLRQEFSIKFPVSEHGKWPLLQRFDFVTHHRELGEQEADIVINLRKREGDDRRRDYPQRYAVLSTLRALSQRYGQPAESWQQRVRAEELRREPSSLAKLHWQR